MQYDKKGEHAHSLVERVFLLSWIKYQAKQKNTLESQQGTLQAHAVRSDFQTVKKQVVFFCEKSPPLAADRHS